VIIAAVLLGILLVALGVWQRRIDRRERARVVSAIEEAKSLGLVNRVLPAADLLAAAKELAGKIAANGPIAVRLALDAALRGASLPLPAGLAGEQELFALISSTADMREGLKGCDVVVMLRLQSERMRGALLPSAGEYFKHYGLTPEKLAYAKADAIVMHPGPMNRGVEIDSIVADGVHSLIREQVEMGVAVRMAVLEALSRNLPNA